MLREERHAVWPNHKLRVAARLGLLMTTLALTAVALSCSQNRFVEREIADLQGRLKAPGEEIGPVSIDRDERSVKAQWEVRSPRTPTAYLEYAAQQLSGDYELTQRTGTMLSLAKQTGGDAFYLQLDVSRPAPGVTVAVTLEARPD
jgi:hypothetical protein